MNRQRHFLKRVAIAGAFLASILLVVSCQQSQQADSRSETSSRVAAASGQNVYVVFEGPWAFASDPKNANMILALAPKTATHRDLNVAASNNSNLASGIYDLSVPTSGGSTPSPVDASFAQVKIDPTSLQHAIDDRSRRYVIRLPKPEAYLAAARFRSRVGPTYPPDASTEQNYVTSVSLRYSITSLSGFSLSGTSDSGTFSPITLQVDTPTVRFAIEPAQIDDPLDTCETHSRQAFGDLVKFLNLTLFVDFPNNPGSCHNMDPQNTGHSKAETDFATPSDRLIALLSGRLTGVQTAGLLGDWDRTGLARRRLLATLYYFHTSGVDCRAPILILGP